MQVERATLAGGPVPIFDLFGRDATGTHHVGMREYPRPGLSDADALHTLRLWETLWQDHLHRRECSLQEGNDNPPMAYAVLTTSTEQYEWIAFLQVADQSAYPG